MALIHIPDSKVMLLHVNRNLPPKPKILSKSYKNYFILGGFLNITLIVGPYT
jgi:hypothetical protein